MVDVEKLMTEINAASFSTGCNSSCLASNYSNPISTC
jgi:hypothetical protein